MKTIKTLFNLSGVVCLLAMFNSCSQNVDKYTRGIGVYPGDPSENFSPTLSPDNQNYRNIARLRAAWHSSSYDYNLTAQLITDGVIINKIPEYISVSTDKGALKKNEREWLFDGKPDSRMRLTGGTNIWLQLDMRPDAPEITRMTLAGGVTYDEKKPKGWQITCFGSADGETWEELGKVKGPGLVGEERPNFFARMRPPRPAGGAARPSGQRPGGSVFPGFPGAPGAQPSNAPQPSFTFNFTPPAPERVLRQTFEFDKPVAYKSYRISFSVPCAVGWNFSDWDFYSGDKKLLITPSSNFNSAWMSAGTGEEWVYIDLGSKSTFDNIKLHWVNKPSKGSVQISDDAKSWSEIASLPAGQDLTDNIDLLKESSARYIRVLMNESLSGQRYILSELEVYGRGGLVPVSGKNPQASGNHLYLDGGSWKIQRASQVTAPGEDISKPDFDYKEWVVATVPGTALASYRNAGALPDPNFGDNQLMISESFFNSDFWYRNEFDVPSNYKGKQIFLNFDGINWKADVYVNGKKAGKIDGAFIRGKFDVKDLIIPGQKNAIAVLIHKNDNIGAIKEKTAISTDQNGGILGADNPTYHASVGWDWIPTIRGRNIGIWNNVFLSMTGPVTIEDPFVTTDLPLPDTTKADIKLEVTLRNHTTNSVSGTLNGKYGNIKFEENVSLGPSETKVVKLDPSTHPSLRMENPKLWWPKGYGKPYLYDAELLFKTTDGISDQTAFRSGVREMAYDTTKQILNIYINGRRFIGRGGNWGFPESNLNYRGREYDVAVAYHADMNFTMIRNWVGQTGDDEFYEACDRHGVMVWQDFWLANPVDGPNPYDPKMFLENAEDMIRRIRNHPSIGIYCGRNEGNPPVVIDSSIRVMIPELHPDLYYISNSSMGVVSGGGPYRALPVRDYYLLYGSNKLHSERGMPNVMTYESLKMTLPEDALWPHNSSMWGMHDFTLEGAQRSASFIEMVEKGFGKPKDAREFTELAQWINYNGYRGMFEGRSQFRQGLLLWMSHPCWPSMVWQTYDYYFDPTAAYFGCKKASEPIHIQWNPVYDTIEVVNYNGKDKKGLTAKAQILNMDGSVQWEKEAQIDCKEDFTAKCFQLSFPQSLSSVHFIKLILKEGEKVISENFYWRGLEDGNYQALRDLPKVELQNNTIVNKSGNEWLITTTLNNPAAVPALMIRLNVTGKKSGERILPAFYSDNYVSLMPGEAKVITIKVRDEDTRGEKLVIEISGFNL